MISLPNILSVIVFMSLPKTPAIEIKGLYYCAYAWGKDFVYFCFYYRY